MILADPTEATLARDVPALVKEGHASLKVFMTYDRLRVDDEQLLDVLAAARDNQCVRLRARREPRHDLVDVEAAAQGRLHGAEVPRHLAIRAAPRRRRSRG